MVRAKKVVNDRFRQTKLDWSAAGKSMRKPEAENEKKAVELKSLLVESSTSGDTTRRSNTPATEPVVPIFSPNGKVNTADTENDDVEYGPGPGRVKRIRSGPELHEASAGGTKANGDNRMIRSKSGPSGPRQTTPSVVVAQPEAEKMAVEDNTEAVQVAVEAQAEPMEVDTEEDHSAREAKFEKEEDPRNREARLEKEDLDAVLTMSKRFDDGLLDKAEWIKMMSAGAMAMSRARQRGCTRQLDKWGSVFDRLREQDPELARHVRVA